jgi:hypothetical protein
MVIQIKRVYAHLTWVCKCADTPADTHVKVCVHVRWVCVGHIHLRGMRENVRGQSHWYEDSAQRVHTYH